MMGFGFWKRNHCTPVGNERVLWSFSSIVVFVFLGLQRLGRQAALGLSEQN
jgi:hypothetical protein